MKKTIREQAHEDIDIILDRAQNLKEDGTEEIEKLKAKAMMMKDNVDGYIKNNPEKSVLIAAGVGLVAGAIIATLMRRK